MLKDKNESCWIKHLTVTKKKTFPLFKLQQNRCFSKK